MQEDAVEVAFCDLCGTSVPASDLQGAAAIRHHDKVVGACCLPALRGGKLAGAALVAGAETRLFPVAVLLLVAIAAATLFLDLELTGAEGRWRQGHEKMLQAQQSDSQVLQGIGVQMDGTARRTDVDSVQAKVQAAVGAMGDAQTEQAKLNDAMQRELASLRQEVRALAGQSIDYRPLFEETRQRQQRTLELVAAMRDAGSGVVPSAPVAVPAPPESAGPTGPVLPPALAEHAKKLQATDPAVRFEAVDELLRSKNQDALSWLLPMAKDPDAYVRRLTVDGLREWKRADVVEVLLAALEDAGENVRDTAYGSLKLVTGQKLPFEATATKDARARAIQRWADWWEKNKATFGS